MSGARDDIPRERSYYRGGSEDPIRGNSPYVPVSGNTGEAPKIPLVGILVVVGVVLAFEHFRKGR